MKILVWVLNIVSALFVLGAALLSALMAETHGDADYNLSYGAGAFAGALFIVALVPSLVALFARGDTRAVIRGIGMMALAGLLILGDLIRLGKAVESQEALGDAKRMGDEMREEAKKQIAQKGDYTPNTQQAQQNIAKLQGELTGDSDTARGGRDLLKISSEMLTKVQASQDIENKGTYTLDAIKTPADLDAQTAQFTKLRAAQADVLDYLQNFDQHCRDALSADGLSNDFITGAIHGARASGQIDLVTSLWKTKLKLTDDFLARQDLLKKNWGQWQFKNGTMQISDDGLVASYNATMKAIRDDAAGIQAVQAQIFK